MTLPSVPADTTLKSRASGLGTFRNRITNAASPSPNHIAPSQSPPQRLLTMPTNNRGSSTLASECPLSPADPALRFRHPLGGSHNVRRYHWSPHGAEVLCLFVIRHVSFYGRRSPSLHSSQYESRSRGRGSSQSRNADHGSWPAKHSNPGGPNISARSVQCLTTDLTHRRLDLVSWRQFEFLFLLPSSPYLNRKQARFAIPEPNFPLTYTFCPSPNTSLLRKDHLLPFRSAHSPFANHGAQSMKPFRNLNLPCRA